MVHELFPEATVEFMKKNRKKDLEVEKESSRRELGDLEGTHQHRGKDLEVLLESARFE
jgi:hypothetical protein